ncbi:MAG: glycosyltransferase [Opitutaceae bacterium]
MNHPPVLLSIGILAWNEERSIGPMLESLFRQSLFGRLAKRRVRCEIVCLANGCTDRTVAIAWAVFRRMEAEHPDRAGFAARVVDLQMPGRNPAWNRFVHEFSAREAAYIGFLDADIIFHQSDTLALVLSSLEGDPNLDGASDVPCKDIALKARLGLRERLSLATSDLTATIAGRINGQLYLLRSAAARNLYLPRDLVANDDGFFKAAICSRGFTTRSDPARVATVAGAAHLYEPYLSVRDILGNQKRQMIGQTAVHVLVEHLRTLPLADRRQLAATLRRREREDPDWLKRLVAAHMSRTRHFWRIFPDVLSFRWRRWADLRGARRLTHLPATCAGFGVTLIASWRAARFLRRGVSPFWPKAVRETILAAPRSTAEYSA